MKKAIRIEAPLDSGVTEGNIVVVCDDNSRETHTVKILEISAGNDSDNAFSNQYKTATIAKRTILGVLHRKFGRDAEIDSLLAEYIDGISEMRATPIEKLERMNEEHELWEALSELKSSEKMDALRESWL